MIRPRPCHPSSARTRRLLAAALLPALLCLLPASGMAQARAADPVLRTLPNGLTLVLQENHAAPVVSIQAWVKTGSTREGPGQIGMAHVLEHMVFKGTPTRGVGEIARQVEAAGGEINAYTSWDTTVYYINMASRFMDQGVDILADMLANALFDPEELARETRVILEEIRRSKDLPASRLSEAFFAEAFAVHPYGRPVIGYQETVSAFTRQGLVDFHRQWYVPENMVWVMAGDLDAEAVLPRLQARLAALPGRPPPVRLRTLEPPQREPRAVVVAADVKEAQLRIGFHVPGIADPGVPALDILAAILGDGKSSRLYREFRMDRRLVNSISCYAMTPEDPGLFIVGAQLEPRDLEQALPEILETVFQGTFDPIGEEEFKTAKAKIESDFIYQMETVQGQARELGYYAATVGDLDFGNQYLEQIRAAGREDVLRVARTYLRPENMTLAVLLPEAAQGEFREEQVLERARNAYARLEARQAREVSGAGPQENPITRYRLQNGATLVVRENPNVPLVSMNAVFLGGQLAETRDTGGISNFTAAMLAKGTPTRDAARIAREIEALAGTLSGFSGRNSLGLSSQVVGWNFGPAFELFCDVLLHPDFPEDPLEKTRQDILAAIKNQEDRLQTVTFDLFWEALYPCHPYGMDPLGTRESVASITREDLRAYYARHAVAPNLVLSVVGDVKAPEVLERVNRALAGMREAAFALPGIRCDTRPQARVQKEVSPDKLQAHIIVGARGASYHDSDRYSLDVLRAILSGMGGRLFTELRDQQSLAYTVAFFNQEAYDTGAVGIYLATQPENRERALAGIREHLERIREEKVTREELERAKNSLLGSYDLSIQTNAVQASMSALFERYGLGCASFLEYPEKIEKVTARQVRKAARKYLRPERLVEVVVIPENRAVPSPAGSMQEESGPGDAKETP